MNRTKSSIVFVFVVVFSVFAASNTSQSQPQFGNFSGSYANAAQTYRNAAAQCRSSAGAACYSKFANYYSCLSQDIGGKTCGAVPTCTASCTESGTAGLIGGMTLESPAAAQNSKAQAIAKLVGLGLKILSEAPSTSGGHPPNSPALEAAKALTWNSPTSEALQAAHSLAPEDGALDQTSSQGVQTTSQAVTELFGDKSSADNIGIETANLLGASPLSASSSKGDSEAVVALLDPNISSSETGAESAAQSFQPEFPSSLLPKDAELRAVLETSTDEPRSSEIQNIPPMFETDGVTVRDGLEDAIEPQSVLASNVLEDEVVACTCYQLGNFATSIPLPAAADSQEVRMNKVFAQSVVGFGDLIKGVASGPIGFAKGLYNYGTKMVNQIGADLGLAAAELQEDGQN